MTLLIILSFPKLLLGSVTSPLYFFSTTFYYAHPLEVDVLKIVLFKPKCAYELSAGLDKMQIQVQEVCGGIQSLNFFFFFFIEFIGHF